MEENLLDTLFPIGKERWLKVKYTDFEWCCKELNMNKPTGNLGFELTSIGIRDEYIPQVSALVDVKDDIIHLLYNKLDDYTISQLNTIFDNKIEQIKDRTIKNNV